MPDCCMARHANAVPPWTCDCPCHDRKNAVNELTNESQIPLEIADAIVTAIEMVVAGAVKSDAGLFDLIKALTVRVMQLEEKVDLLLMGTRGKH